jgi:EmrB/QacA subfamily drug resistance transporter
VTTVTAPPTEQPRSPVMSHRQIMLVIYGLMAGMFLSALDQTIVGTAIRTIGDDLHGLNQQAWVTTAYLITSTIATPIYGKLSDLFGRRPLYIFAITIFVLGSLMSSFSTSMLMLASFRAVQGIGAGGLMSLPLAIMGDMLAPRERAKYQGYFLAVFGVSSVIGPLVGGLFAGADQILFISGWRWVFLVNVPVGAVALFMVLTFLHLPRFGAARKPRIDWWGASAVIATLVPMLLVAEQGREWGWASAGSIACYVIGAVGLVTFIVAETLMKDDAIIPLKLFRSGVFSMATVLGVLVGFGMFGAMLTLPLYLQIVTGLTPTESGFATLPMVAGMMTASIGSGQIISRTGKYRIFPVAGTAFMSIGFLWLTTVTVDKPLWYLMIGMFVIGLGLGQLMQTLTLASQNSVPPRDMGVATSASTFFRQIGGTLGTAVLLSVLFSTMPTNISSAMADKGNLTSALDAALTPSVAAAPQNAGIMKQLWAPMTKPIKAKVQDGLDTATTKVRSGVKAAVTEQVAAGVQAQVQAGAVPAAAAATVTEQQVAKALPGATAKALQTTATKAHASVVDGRLAVDWSNASERRYYVDKIVPTIITQIHKGTSSSTSSASSGSDTSFLKGADQRLSKPFLTGFNVSAVQIYWVGLIVLLVAFVLSLFFRVPPLRQRSALQEQADHAADKDRMEVEAADAAALAGSQVGPVSEPRETVGSRN